MNMTKLSDEESRQEHHKMFLSWVHIALNNAKRLLLDVHHRLKTNTYNIISMSSFTNSIGVISIKRCSTY